MGPGVTFELHRHAERKLLCCLSGQITFQTEGGAELELGPGDWLELAPGAAHSARAGVECVEGFVVAPLSPPQRRRLGIAGATG